MLFRLKVMTDSLDPGAKSFQAKGPTNDAPAEDVDRVARDLEAGVATRFYRGGQPHGRVVTARATADHGLWVKIHLTTKDADIWKLVETGAVNTIEIQKLPQGVDVFLKSVAATYPSAMA